MIESNKNTVFEKMFSVYNKHILKKHFSALYLKGQENFINRNKNIPTLIYANHSNWWDGLIAFYLSYNLWKSNAFIMMDYKQMKKYYFFKWIGAFSVDKESVIDSYRSFKYAAGLMKVNTNILWLFPQGVMLPNDLRPIKFEKGLSKLIEISGNINLLPLVFNYEFLSEQRPEAFIEILPAVNFELNNSSCEMTEVLENIISDSLNSQKAKIITGNINSYELLLKGKGSSNKIIDRMHNA